MFISVCPIKKYDVVFTANSLNDFLYVIKDWPKNKAKSKPKQTQTKPIFKMPKMSVSVLTIRYYGKKQHFAGTKTKPIQSKSGVVCGFAGTGSKPIHPQRKAGG